MAATTRKRKRRARKVQAKPVAESAIEEPEAQDDAEPTPELKAQPQPEPVSPIVFVPEWLAELIVADVLGEEEAA